MLYRVLESLRFLKSNKQIEAGTIDKLEGLSAKTIAALLVKNRIAEVIPPPLAVLPGWEEKAEAYAKQGIKDVNDMSEAEEGVVDEDDFDVAMRWSNGDEVE